MYSKQITSGTRVVIISANSIAGPFTSRLYVNSGETATLQSRKAKTLAGAEKQARALLNPNK